MLHETEIRPEEVADEWAIRSEFWNSQLGSSKPKRRKRERNSTPLILCGHGVSLRIESDALAIRDGFTHYPQQQATYRYFRGDLDLPPRIVLLDGSGTLSFDVLSWLGEQGVALARVTWTGAISVAGGGFGYAADPAKVEWQRITRADAEKRLAFASDLIRRKLDASIATLEMHFAPSPVRDAALAKARAGIGRLAKETFADLSGMFAIEGECAVAYFNAWRLLELRWTGTARKPIPADWQSFTSRSSLLSGKVPKNRGASHPVNAILNYAYTVRQSQLQIDAVANGYDPTLGIMHNRHQGSNAYILDLIEPERPIVDAAILPFLQGHSFSAADFVIRRDGVCRLSPQLARKVATLIAP
jgi:CRISPR/Cas system-associated endonuclease Cas1